MQCESCGQQNVDGARFCAKCGALVATHEEGPDPLIGQLIGGRYRVTGVLGEGGMGKVYIGEQQMGSTVRKVAIKTLHQHLSKNPSVLQRFHRECGTVAQLEHPNTIKFFDFGATQDGTLYIAMEFVAGRPLAEVIEKEGALASERVVKIMRQVCGVLDEAHLQGIIHRDLKPENIILTNRAGETDFVKVLDFGIAARTESSDAQKEAKLTQQGMVLGTPPYMSPEQFTGKALDLRSDIYSLGVMAYEMLVGKLPFEADTPWQWATQHMTAQPTPFEVSAPAKKIPPAMRQAILKSLSKDRDQRPGSAREFFAELSEGARMTVVAEPQQASTGTAAMAATPDFGASAPIQMAPAHGHGRPGPTAPGVVAPAIIAPAPSASRKSGSNKGLIVGLGAVAGLLLIAIAVVAARSLKGNDGPNTLEFTASPTAGGSVTSIGPTETPPENPTATPSATPSATTPPTTTSTGPKVTPSGGGTGTSKPPAADPCEQCIALAKGGSLGAASGFLSKCTDEAKKNECKNAGKRAGPGAVKVLAFNGRCAEAKAAVNAGSAFGIPKKALESAASTCK